MTGYLYTDPALPCCKCGEMSNYGARQDLGGPHDRWVCDECTDGRGLSDYGKQVMREVAQAPGCGGEDQ